ncbi:ROK family protein [Rhodopirellula sp. SWK7]|uniref:ROK family protein n=1 Tax=Rhodopirellula sp. SWK7 TaxID=595460 RepID=UPI0002BE7395|nr:ROK family protein [Rhodopirellula sp. SWK7]EMI44093.1 ROK family protein [Rhodopirellula sp. SWK7]
MPSIDVHDHAFPPSSATAPFYWGIDIGGTSIKCGLVDHDGHTIAFEQVPTQESEGPEAAVRRLTNLVNETEERCGVVGKVPGIGMGSPGPMDLPRGRLVAPPQLPSWWDFPIVDELSKATGRNVSFLNDANAAAYGEFWLGSGSKHSSMLLLTLGTGVGGGIIIENELVNGVNSFGSECGHILVDSAPDAQLCQWGGGRGQLEAYASATGVVAITRKRLRDVPDSQLYRYLKTENEEGDHGKDELTSKRVYDAAVAGDKLANSIIDDTARWLGIAITTLVHTVDPGSVVLGGAMNFGGDACPIGKRFLQHIRDEFRERTFPNVFEGTTISFATLGSDAGYLGAAGYARKVNS